jgi:surface polysaccharide O-acyltransferase-like enzyme
MSNLCFLYLNFRVKIYLCVFAQFQQHFVAFVVLFLEPFFCFFNYLSLIIVLWLVIPILDRKENTIISNVLVNTGVGRTTEKTGFKKSIERS